MPDKNQQSARDQDAARRRFKDFVILTIGAIGVLSLLFLTRAVGLVEWLTGGTVMLAGSLAYYVGSQPSPVAPAIFKPDASLKLPAASNHTEAVAALIVSMPFPALMVRSDGRLDVTNAAAQDIFGIEDMTDRLATAVMRQPDLIDAIDRVSSTGAHELVEFSIHDDAAIWMAHLRTGPDIGDVFIVFEEMTAVRRAELARADFLANASHELRTPLTALAGFIETMRGPAKDDRGSWDGFLEIMQQQTDRMKRLVADLLSLSRIEFSEHKSPSTHVDAIALLDRAGLSLQPIAERAGVILDLNLASGPIEIVADADEFMQVIQNLVTNAIKYAPKNGRVQVSLGTAATMQDAADSAARQSDAFTRALLLDPRASAQVPAVWLRVEDNGVGISAEHLPRLGERFYRADESRGGRIEGTGLGLAIVKHIMARHRGGLAVESLEDEGTAFGIWLPLAPPA